MILQIEVDAAPLVMDEAGVMHIGGTRVPLDTVITAFHQGATAEEIVQHFPTLELADVYLTIGYYLRHAQAVDVCVLVNRCRVFLRSAKLPNWAGHQRSCASRRMQPGKRVARTGALGPTLIRPFHRICPDR
ncbi:DUF433 domain-containing protein [bacterium]|nr:DUF433 domain-containing protein [bacterium]